MDPKETGLKATVASVKVIARDILRGKLIARRQSRIGELEADKKTNTARLKVAADNVAAAKKNLAVAEYEKAHIPADHPAKDDLVKEADEDIKASKEFLVEVEKSEVEIKADVVVVEKALDEAIKEQNDGIAKIESGETKVSKEDLSELVDKLMVEHGRESVRNL